MIRRHSRHGADVVMRAVAHGPADVGQGLHLLAQWNGVLSVVTASLIIPWVLSVLLAAAATTSGWLAGFPVVGPALFDGVNAVGVAGQAAAGWLPALPSGMLASAVYLIHNLARFLTQLLLRLAKTAVLPNALFLFSTAEGFGQLFLDRGARPGGHTTNLFLVGMVLVAIIRGTIIFAVYGYLELAVLAAFRWYILAALPVAALVLMWSVRVAGACADGALALLGMPPVLLGWLTALLPPMVAAVLARAVEWAAICARLAALGAAALLCAAPLLPGVALAGLARHLAVFAERQGGAVDLLLPPATPRALLWACFPLVFAAAHARALGDALLAAADLRVTMDELLAAPTTAMATAAAAARAHLEVLRVEREAQASVRGSVRRGGPWGTAAIAGGGQRLAAITAAPAWPALPALPRAACEAALLGSDRGAAPQRGLEVCTVPSQTIMAVSEGNEYTLGEIAGEGSFAEVFRAKDKHGSTVAVKRARVSLGRYGDAVTSTAMKEYTTVKNLGEHPNVVQFHDIFKDNEVRLCIVMEFAAGGSAKARMEGTWGLGDDAPVKFVFPPKDVAAVALDIASALKFVHENLCVHCDIKPGNIVFNDEGRALLADFGSAKVVEDISARLGDPTASSTMEYNSPEVLGRRNPATAASDIWSLGVTLLELLTGCGALAKKPSTQQVLSDAAFCLSRGLELPWSFSAALDALEEAPRAAWEAADQGLKDLIASCLVVDPGKRPTAAALLDTPLLRAGR